MLYLALACLFIANAQKVFLCPTPSVGSVNLDHIGQFVHVFDEPPSEAVASCVDVSPPTGITSSFLVRRVPGLKHHADQSIPLSQQLDCVITQVPSLVSGITSEFVVIQCPDESLETLHIQLYTHDFVKLTEIMPADDSAPEQDANADFEFVSKQLPGKDSFVKAVLNMSTEHDRILTDLTGAPGSVLGIKTRCSYAPAHTSAADYILKYFRQHGGLQDSSMQYFKFGKVNTQNVLAVKPGTTNPDEIIVVGGHYDSTSPSCKTLAPGAVDNGGGCTMAMLLAKATKNLSFKRTIHFVCFGGEEQGLYGSQHYVRTSSDDIRASLINDMIGYSNKFYGVTFEGVPGKTVDLMNIATENAVAYTPKLQTQQKTFSFGSDHVPFQRAGIPCFLFIEMDDTEYPCYHQTCDTIDQVNTNQSIDIIALAGATLWDVSNGGFN